MPNLLPPACVRFRFGKDLLVHLRRIQAYLARYGNHDWTEAWELPLNELFSRFDALKSLVNDEGGASELDPSSGG